MSSNNGYAIKGKSGLPNTTTSSAIILLYHMVLYLSKIKKCMNESTLHFKKSQDQKISQQKNPKIQQKFPSNMKHGNFDDYQTANIKKVL